MRDTFFRGKDRAGWVCGDLIHKNGSVFIKPYMDMAYPVDPDTVGQYIRLEDKHGVKIFEGDIVRISTNGTRSLETYSIDFVPEIGMYVIHNHRDMEDDRDFTIMHGYELEVIGNVHDNPELLKEGKNHERA